ncbi:MAG: phospholipid/cholesterol/gamma-HCH transport system substrate-binding protein [Pseudonocardiales bacterium]|nr:phospholipid/cholesterol/gamma-HCH transport system substrate-binding protein [Pseudonocardiales bacterium]
MGLLRRLFRLTGRSQGGLIAPLIKLVVFLVVTAFATYVLGATIANTAYGSTTSFKAMFTDTAGLTNGDDVRIAGVRVGTVSGIKIVKDTNAADCLHIQDNRSQVTPCYLSRVSFTVIKSRPLPKSVEATLKYRNLVGQRYLDIAQGAGDPTLMKKGDTIPVAQTHPALDLTFLFNGFKPLFQGLDAPSINDLSGEIIQTLQGEGGALETLLGTLADLTNTLADKDKVIGDVVNNLASVLTAVGNRDQELSDLITQLQGFVSGLSGDRATIGAAIDGINTLATTTTNLLSQVRAPLARDITDLSALSVNLNNNKATLQKVFDNLPDTAAVLTRTGSYGSWFNFYLCSLKADIQLPGGTILPIDLHQPVNVPRCNP